MIAEVHRKTWNEMLVKMIADSHIFSSFSHNFVMAGCRVNLALATWCLQYCWSLDSKLSYKNVIYGGSKPPRWVIHSPKWSFFVLWNYELKFWKLSNFKKMDFCNYSTNFQIKMGFRCYETSRTHFRFQKTRRVSGTPFIFTRKFVNL